MAKASEQLDKEIEVPEDLQVEVLNKKQRFWKNIEENAIHLKKQYEDQIILQKEIINMARDFVEKHKDQE